MTDHDDNDPQSKSDPSDATSAESPLAQTKDGPAKGEAKDGEPKDGQAKDGEGQEASESSGGSEESAEPPKDAEPVEGDDNGNGIPDNRELRARKPVTEDDLVEAEAADPMEVKAEAEKKSRGLKIGLIALAVLFAVGGLLSYLLIDAKGEERRQFAAARRGDTEATWQAYVDWAAELRESGGLTGWMTSRFTEFDDHEHTANQNVVLARTREAVAAENYPLLCEIIRAEPAASEATRLATEGLAERVAVSQAAYTAALAQRETPPGIQNAFTGAFAWARAHPCEASLKFEVSHEVFAEDAGIDIHPSGESQSVRAMLEGIALDEHAAAIVSEIGPDLEQATGGVLRLVEGDAVAPFNAHITVSLRSHERFVTPSGQAVPGIALHVKTDVSLPGSGTFSNEEIFRAPSSIALEFFRAQGDMSLAEVYQHAVEALWENVRAKARQAVGLERYTTGTVRVSYGCQNPDPLVANRVTRGALERGVDFFSGTCGPSVDDMEDYNDYTDDDYEAMAMPESAFRLVVSERSEVAIEVDGEEFAPVIYIREDCAQATTEVACSDDIQLVTELDPGVYTVFVDTMDEGADGPFRVYAAVRPEGANAAACQDAAAFRAPYSTVADTRRGEDRMQGTCGGVGANERVHTLTVAERSRLRCEVTSGGEQVLYWRSDCADPETERRCAFGISTRNAMVQGMADAGAHAIVVDGSDFGAHGAHTLQCEVLPENGDGAEADSCDAPGTIEGSGRVAIDSFHAHDDERLSCGLDGGADLVYRLELATASQVHLSLADGAIGAIGIGTTCGASDVVCATGAAAQTLAAGTYFVTIDGRGIEPFTRGALNVQIEDLQAVCDEAPLLLGGTTQVALAEHTSRLDATCARSWGNRWALRKVVLTNRARVVARSSRGGLALFGACGADERLCRSNAAAERSIDQVLEPGTYYLAVAGSTAQETADVTMEITRQP